MTLNESTFELNDFAANVESPVLIVSTMVGRGMYSLGEAIRERLPVECRAEHEPIEALLPGSAVIEDLERYKTISNRARPVLYLIYKIPIFYYRKYARERWFVRTKLEQLRTTIERLRPRTVVCVSHRPAFWVSNLKDQHSMQFRLWGVLGEYGNSLGWRYIFWNQMDGFLSPLSRSELSYPFPERLRFQQIILPARRGFYELAGSEPRQNSVLVVCGFWGQGPIKTILRTLLSEDCELQIHVVCGENKVARLNLEREFCLHSNILVYGVVESLIPLMKESACVVTKPGISTLVEAHAAGRKIFLIKGMPVAEDNNAWYSMKHFGAEWFSADAFRMWRAAVRQLHSGIGGVRRKQNI